MNRFERFFFNYLKLFIGLLDPLTHHFSSYIVRITALRKLSILLAVFPIETWKGNVEEKEQMILPFVYLAMI